jgi:glucosyl-3-phosphoglycerate synthase
VEASSSEIVVFCDADLRPFDPTWVERLARPLVDPTLQLVKPVYGRPLRLPNMAPVMDEGGRVTELLVRPLLGALAPELARLHQPLAGEYAARRSALLGCGFPLGYGVEIALLLQIADLFGSESVAEVDLHGERWHRNRPLHELSATAAEVLCAALSVLESQGRIKLPELSPVELVAPRGA